MWGGGGGLGPLLFIMYINDLPNWCPSVNCQMYADDTIIHVPTETPSLAGEHPDAGFIKHLGMA